jgi:hypothetical protein
MKTRIWRILIRHTEYSRSYCRAVKAKSSGARFGAVQIEIVKHQNVMQDTWRNS